MKTTELRIGNWVSQTEKYYNDGGLLNIVTIKKLGVYIKSVLDNTEDEYTFKWRLNQIYPIPLTEKWLLKFGFEKIKIEREIFKKMELDIVYCKNDYGVFYQKDLTVDYDGKNVSEMYYDVSFHFRNGNGIKTELKYIHQLQNLYFALTNKELTTKE